MYASVCVEVQLLIYSSVPLFRLKFAAVCSRVQKCCPRACSVRGQWVVGNPPPYVCYSKPQVSSHSVSFCKQPNSKPIKYSLFVKINKYSNDSLAFAFP